MVEQVSGKVGVMKIFEQGTMRGKESFVDNIGVKNNDFIVSVLIHQACLHICLMLSPAIT